MDDKINIDVVNIYNVYIKQRMELTPLYTKLRQEITDIVKTRKIEVNDALTLVVVGIQILNKSKNLSGKEKQKVLMTVLEDIAKGNDGQFGTADDVIPEVVWKQIEMLMSSGMIQSAINVCYSLLTGRFPNLLDVGHQVFTCCNVLGGVFGKK